MTDSDKSPIDFWFDFSSPYGYLLSEKIDAVAATVNAMHTAPADKSCSQSGILTWGAARDTTPISAS